MPQVGTRNDIKVQWVTHVQFVKIAYLDELAEIHLVLYKGFRVIEADRYLQIAKTVGVMLLEHLVKQLVDRIWCYPGFDPHF
jgi:hypothetical protein